MKSSFEACDKMKEGKKKRFIIDIIQWRLRELEREKK